MSQSSTTGRASEPTPAQLKELFAQIESGRITKERLQAFLRGQDPAFPSYSVTVDYSQAVEQLVRSGRYDWADSDITSHNFLSPERGVVKIGILLLNFDRSNISSEDAIKAMDSQGIRPATLKELLALGAVHPDLQGENPIVALGSMWRDSLGRVLVPYLHRSDGCRHLGLYWFVDGWRPDWRFAAVRK